MNAFVSAIIVAAGTGSRIKTLKEPKQFYKLDGKTVLYHAARKFSLCALVNEIIVVTLPDYIDYCKKELSGLSKITAITAGGKTRQESVYFGLQQVNENCGIVAIHDGARPLVGFSEINASIINADNCATVVGTRVIDTIKVADEKGFVEYTLDRGKLWQIQTPQVIPKAILDKAYEKAINENITATDDVSLVEYLGYPVKIIEGSYTNIKITSDKDLLLAEHLYKNGGNL